MQINILDSSTNHAGIQHEYNHFGKYVLVCNLVLHSNIDDDLMFHVNHKLMSCYSMMLIIKFAETIQCCLTMFS